MESHHHRVHVRCNLFTKLKNYASHLQPAHLCWVSSGKVCSLQVLLFFICKVVVESCRHSLQDILEAVEFYCY